MRWPASAAPGEHNSSSVDLASVNEHALETYDGTSVRLAGDAATFKHFSWNDKDECSVAQVTYRRMSSIPPVAFAVGPEQAGRTGEPRIEDRDLDQAKLDVQDMFTDDQRERLIKLYFQYVYPYFPILSKRWVLTPEASLSARIDLLPLSLASALYATSLPFILHDDVLNTTLAYESPSRSKLYRICWIAIQTELHAPTLSTLQACLLLLQRGPTNQYLPATPFRASLMGWTVGLATILGLNHDCSEWNSMPLWERRVRARVWWAVCAMDCWISVETGTPPLICTEETSVQTLLPDTSLMGALNIPKECLHFYHLAELGCIMHAVHSAFYSVRASAPTSRDLGLSLELARGLRSRLSAWKQRYSADCPLIREGYAEPNGNPALELAYLVANIMVFRALLRAIPDEDDSTSDHSDSINAVLAGALNCGREAVHFLEAIAGSNNIFTAFWHSWSQSNFAIVSSFLTQMLMMQTHRSTFDTPSERTMSMELASLVGRWRQAIRAGAGSGGWGQTLMGLALQKLNVTMAMSQVQQKNGS